MEIWTEDESARFIYGQTDKRPNTRNELQHEECGVLDSFFGVIVIA